MAKKPVAKKPPALTKKKTPNSRKLAPVAYKSFRLQKRIRHQKPALPSGFKLLRGGTRLLMKNWKLFGGIILVYLVLNIALVKGLSRGLDVQGLRDTIEPLFGGTVNDFAFGLTVFALYLGLAGKAPTDLAAGYQSILLIITSLVIIWALRQRLAGERITIRDAFYKSMYPLIPYILVLLVVVLQLLPIIISAYIFQWAFSGINVINGAERTVLAALLFCMAVLSFYMVTSSVFALYIVTLPNMQPMKALRTARQLVRYRRMLVMRKLLFLPFILLIIGGVITVPVILYLTPIAEWLFFVLTMIALAVFHSYVYMLYRELI